MRTLLNRAGPWCLAGLLLLLTACAEQQAATPPPPPPQVTVRQPIVREVVEWDEYTGRTRGHGIRRGPGSGKRLFTVGAF